MRAFLFLSYLTHFSVAKYGFTLYEKTYKWGRKILPEGRENFWGQRNLFPQCENTALKKLPSELSSSKNWRSQYKRKHYTLLAKIYRRARYCQKSLRVFADTGEARGRPEARSSPQSNYKSETAMGTELLTAGLLVWQLAKTILACLREESSTLLSHSRKSGERTESRSVRPKLSTAGRLAAMLNSQTLRSLTFGFPTSGA